MKDKPKVLSRFLGLNNVLDPMVGDMDADGKPRTWEWQQQADNVNLTNAGKYVRRDGFKPFLSGANVTAAFSTVDFQRLYLIDSGTLGEIQEDGTAGMLHEGLTGPAYWAEVNQVVYLSSSEKLEVRRDGTVRPWGVPTPVGGALAPASGSLPAGTYQVCFTHADDNGREGGSSPSLSIEVADGGIALTDIPTIPGYYTCCYLTDGGAIFYRAATYPWVVKSATLSALPEGPELTTELLNPPPENGGYVAHFGARMYIAEYLPASDTTVVWASEPLGYHLFDLDKSFFLVPGEVTQLADAGTSLLVVTRHQVFAYTGSGIKKLADYGAPHGQHISHGPAPAQHLYFWTDRGLCRAEPFENLTEGRVSVPPGSRVAGGVIQQHGYTRYVAVLKSGGAAFNKR